MNTLQFFSNQRATYSIRQFCQVLRVVPSRYCAWRHGAVKKVEPARETAMVAAFDDHKRRYGTRHLRVELREKGHRVSRQPLRTALRRHGRKALQPKASTPRTTDSTHGQFYAPNLPLDQPHPTQANRVWVSDIICLPLASGTWACRCAFQGACTKQVVDWQVRADVPKNLVTSTLQALLAQRPTPGFIVRSDRGGQYVGNTYKALLHRVQARLSLSWRGGCDDNTQAENRLKVLGANGHASKRRSPKPATGPSLPTWPTRRLAPLPILTTIVTTADTPTSAIQSPISFTNNNSSISPNSLLLNQTTSDFVPASVGP